MKFHAPEYVRRMAPYQAGKPIGELAREYGLDEASIVACACWRGPGAGVSRNTTLRA